MGTSRVVMDSRGAWAVGRHLLIAHLANGTLWGQIWRSWCITVNPEGAQFWCNSGLGKVDDKPPKIRSMSASA